MLIFIFILWGVVGAGIAAKLVMDDIHETQVPLHKRIVTGVICGPIVWGIAIVLLGYKRLIKWLKG